MHQRSFYPRNSKVNLILTLGVLSFVLFGPFTGIPAWIWGNAELKHIKNGITDPSDKNLVQTGIVLGIIGSIFTVIWIVLKLMEVFE